ncbi:MAG TPA: alpha/beta fold hydrolase [Noviherbaspirillum sp.]
MATREQNIDIEVDGITIAGTVIAPQARMPGVLFVHGWGGCQEQYLARAHKLAALGCVCMTFDLRGHAQTRGQHETVTRESNLADVLAAYERLVAQPEVDPERIAVIGSSYGGYMAALLTALRRVRWLVLRAPALYRDEGWDLPKRQLHKGDDLELYRRSVVAADQNRALRACAAFAGDVLIVESGQDVVIPHPVVTSYVEACTRARSLTYRVLDEADHGLSDPASQEAYTSLLLSWWAEMTGMTGTLARAGAVPAARAA